MTTSGDNNLEGELIDFVKETGRGEVEDNAEISIPDWPNLLGTLERLGNLSANGEGGGEYTSDKSGDDEPNIGLGGESGLNNGDGGLDILLGDGGLEYGLGGVKKVLDGVFSILYASGTCLIFTGVTIGPFGDETTASPTTVPGIGLIDKESGDNIDLLRPLLLVLFAEYALAIFKLLYK